MEPTEVIATVNVALTLYEKVRGLITDLTRKLPDGPLKNEAAKDLAEAEETMQLAKVELAKGLGLPLCQRHFPPGIKLDIREDIFPRWKCATCGYITPHKPDGRERARTEYF